MLKRLLKPALLTAVVLALLLSLAAYKRETRFEAFIADFESLNDEVVRVISGNPTPAGVAEARKVLDAQKDSLRKRLAELKTMTAGQAGGEKLSQIEDCLKRTPAKISAPFVRELGRRQQELDRMQAGKLTVSRQDVENARKENEQFVKEMELLLNDYESIIY